MRKWFAFLTAAAVTAGAAAPAVAATPIKVLVGDQELDSAVAPFLENGRTMVPLAPLAEQFGFDVTTSEDGQHVELVRWPKRVELTVGSDAAVANGQETQLSAPVQNVDGTIFVPVRFVSEELGGKVSWDQENWTATVEPPSSDVVQAWDLLQKSNQSTVSNIKGTGTVTTTFFLPEGAEIPAEPYTVTMNLEVLSEGNNALATVTAEGEDLTVQSALYQDQLWVMMPGQGWLNIDLGDLTGMLGLPAGVGFDVDALQQLSDQMLASVDAAVTGQENINGVDTYKVDMDLSNSFDMFADMIPQELDGVTIDLGVDKYQMSLWIDADGFTHKATYDMAMTLVTSMEGESPIKGQINTTGEFRFEPLTEAITWPVEILNPAPAEPAEEQPAAEQPAADQPAEEQPAAEQPADEQPAAEQPAAEQPAADQPAAEQPAAEQPAAE